MLFYSQLRYSITMHILAICCLMLLSRASGVKNITHSVARHARSLGYPEGSTMGIFFAIGLPLDIPGKSIQVSMYMEANYQLPGEWNATYYLDNPDIEKRSLDRRMAYDILANKLDSFGYSGEHCLPKIICEVAHHSFDNNGVIGDVLRILFTPSSSRNENLPSRIVEAEFAEDCDNEYQECPESPLALISHRGLSRIS